MADLLSTFHYPTIVSRTLDPNGKSLRTIVALHDHEITDADINLIQDIQDSKRAAVLNDMVSSGSLTYAPMSYNTNNPNTLSRFPASMFFSTVRWLRSQGTCPPTSRKIA